MKKVKSILMADNVSFYNGDIIDYVYGDERVKSINKLTDLHPEVITSKNFEENLDVLQKTEVIFSCWGMLKLSTTQLDKMPSLKAVFYAGGSINGFAPVFAGKNITICNAVEANAVSVAEFCVAQILLSCKNAYQNSQACGHGPWEQSKMPVGPGVYGETIALIGIGAISRHVLKLLKSFHLRIIAVSNYLQNKPEQVKEMGIDKLVTTEEAFREGYVVSNHLPDRESNKNSINSNHFNSMRRGATFINTGRGAQVNEADICEVLFKRPDLTALLDVQHPEPPAQGSKLFTLPNIHLTSHIAGCTNDEVRRMADYMLEEFLRWQKNEPLKHQIDLGELVKRA